MPNPYHSLTKDDVPPEITQEAREIQCAEHPDAGWHVGLGYAGGGYGHYKVCRECDRVYAKVAVKDESNA
jgi:hypothetical protein